MHVCVCRVFQPACFSRGAVPPATASDTRVIGSDRDRSESPRRGIAARGPGLHLAALSRQNYVKQSESVLNKSPRNFQSLKLHIPRPSRYFSATPEALSYTSLSS